MRFLIFIIFCLGSVLNIPVLRAESINKSAYVGVVSKYLWRGQNLYDNVALQPGFDISYKNLNFGFWGSFNTKEAEFGEADYTLSFTRSINTIELSTGLTYYTFPNIKDTSKEIFVSASFDIILSPGLCVYYDFGTGNGAYLETCASIPLKLLPITADITLGYNFGQWNYNPSFSVITTTISYALSIKKIEISPSFFSQFALNKQYQNDIAAGLTISYNF